MRTKRLLGAAAAATIAAIAPLSATIATAQEVQGVGTGTVSATVLQVDVGEDGNVLSVRLLGDDGTSSTDPANGAPSSSTTVTPLTVRSGLVPALNLTTAAVQTSSSGAEDSKTFSSDDYGLPAVPTVSGTVSGSLSSVVDSLGARSGVDAALDNLGVAGGLLSVPSAAVALTTKAAAGSTEGVRSISIPSIEVLNLAATLEALGSSLTSLTLDDLFDLLDKLGLAIPGVVDPAALVAEVDGALDALEGETGPLTADLCATVGGTLDTITDSVDGAIGDVTGTVGGVVGGGTPPVPGGTGTPVDGVIGGLSAQGVLDEVSCVVDEIVGTVEDLVRDLQDLVDELLSAAVALLGDTSLLSVSGIEIGLTASAAPTLESTVAAVSGTIGSVKVGALEVPGVSGLDLTAAADVLNVAGDTISDAVGQVLGLINAELAGLVDVEVLDIVETVSAEGGYTKALASVTALTATITPPNLLGAALSVEDTVAGALREVGAAVPALSPVMAQLETALGGLDVLTSPTTITVGRLSSQAMYRPLSAGETPPSFTGTDSGTPTGTPTGELPRTGADAALPAMAAVLAGGIALMFRRFLRTVTAD